MLGRSVGGALLVVILLAATVEARTATLRVQARLRQGPSAATELLGWVPEGTRVDILGESTGWRQVTTPDGRSGFIWGEHLIEGEAATPPAAAPVPAPAAAVRPVEEPKGPPTATAADLERVRAELERLATAQRELARHLEAPPPVPTPTGALETPFGLAPVAFLLGGVLGFAASRVLQRRRDRHQWNRLRV